MKKRARHIGLLVLFALVVVGAVFPWGWIAVAAWIVLLVAGLAYLETKNPPAPGRLLEAAAEPGTEATETPADIATRTRSPRRTPLW